MINKSEKLELSSDLTLIAKGAGIVFAGTLIGTALKYLFDLFAARILGPEMFGIFFIGLAILRIMEVVSTVGVHNGVLRFIALFAGENDIPRIKGILILGSRTGLIAGLPMTLLVILLAKPISIHVFHNQDLTDPLRLIALGIPFSALTMIFLYATQGFKVMKYRVYTREIYEPLIRLVFLVPVLLISWKLLGVVGVFILSLAAGTGLSYLYLKKLFPPFTQAQIIPVYETKKLYNFSWPLLLMGVLNLMIMWINILMIGRFLTEQKVGIFGPAHRTAFLAQTVLISFNSIFAPMISDLFNRRQLGKLENLHKIVAKWMFAFNFPIILLMIIFSREILSLFGKDYLEGTASLIILGAAYLTNSLIGSTEHIIMMTGKSQINFFNSLTLLSAIVFLNIVLIPKYGIEGAAYSTLISFGFMNIVRLLEVRLSLKIHPYTIRFLKPVIAGGICGGLLFILKKHIMLKDSSLLLMAAGAVVFLGLYVLILFLLGIDDEDRMIWNKLRRKLLNKSTIQEER